MKFTFDDKITPELGRTQENKVPNEVFSEVHYCIYCIYNCIYSISVQYSEFQSEETLTK